MRVKYCGPAKDYSGYGEANRHDIAALNSVDIDVSVELTRHCLEISEFGHLGKLVSELEGNRGDFDFKIIHTTPNIYGQFIEPNKYHIGRVFWETDKLPPDFAAGAQLCDEIWTGSEFNKQAIINAGVTKPIFIIPEAVVTDINPESIEPFVVSNKNSYKFYSVFEWTERKNPKALLEAYYKEFTKDDNVSLTLKTYVDNFTPDKKKQLEEKLIHIKNELNLPYYAPVLLCVELLNRQQMYRFHRTFDCFVSAHRGEGWGIPQMEAMLMAKPIISTNCGGIHEYLTDNYDAMLVDYVMTEVNNSRNQQWYREEQHWADIDIEDLRRRMRYAFEAPKHMESMGRRARETVKQKFDIQIVGEMMKQRLEQISR